MGNYDVVIIGGGPAGVTCAISARNTYPDKSIALIRNQSVTLIPCGIPYVINTLNSVADDVLPDKLLEVTKTDLIVDEVIGRENKTLHLKSGKKISYTKLVLAVGSTPIKPPIEGADKDGIFLVTKDRETLSMVREKSRESERIVIVGGGYIGVELADELLKAGKQVSLVELKPHLLPVSMDPEFGEKAKEILEDAGGRIFLNNKAKRFLGKEKVAALQLEDNTKIDADMVIISAGCRPNTKLAQLMDIDYYPEFGIKVDEYLRTSDRDVFAIGDCAAKHDFFTGEYSPVMLASTAMAEGRLVGSNLFQVKVMRKYTGVLGSFSTKIGNTAFGVSGITENKAKAMNLDYVTGESNTVDRHPGKLPGASQMHLKLIFARYSHTLLGAQMYGGDSIGEMVNMFAVMILNKMTDMEIDNLQIGTHPLLTASPIAYPVINATVDAINKWYRYQPTAT
ncbi:MAG: pyridine nucleotide-disulfide oxidoreductase [Calditrichaeota bacterium]|nr:FAD-dependent oxidoreductase [Calditrichota bacterium]RQW00085.1 MAG: pyridine nucleotide-disulfide oxidoreductase [Calditrichota bacterium]